MSDVLITVADQYRRLRLPALSEDAECVDREQVAVSTLSNHELNTALQEYHASSQADRNRPESTDNQDKKKAKKRPRDERLEAVRKLSRVVKELRAVENFANTVKLDEIFNKVPKWKCLEYLVSEVEKGIHNFRHTPRNFADRDLRPFAALVEYRRTRDKDCGSHLRSVLYGLAEEAKPSAVATMVEWKREVWINNFLAESTYLIQTRLDPAYSRTGDVLAEKSERARVKRPKVFNKIVNGLREHTVGGAWAFYHVLIGECLLFGCSSSNDY